MAPLIDRTRVAAYGLAVSGSRVLLARASHLSALPGTWWLPGGGVEFGEAPREAVVREFIEETGLTVRVNRLVDVLSDVGERHEADERLHTVRVIYGVDVTSGRLRSEVGGTTDEVAWVERKDLSTLPVMSFFQDALSEV